ncbi:MAG: hypothetical protein M1823_001989 [Watsoniomyces obsoletus]|nr:MAG: hypothetical protein M1823_001989 [Watsoniomyces obsoletus]
MRSQIWLWPALLAGHAQLISAQAPIYFFGNDAGHDRPDTPIISPPAARLLLAKWLGVSHYHRVSGLDDSSLQHLQKLQGLAEEGYAAGGDIQSFPSRLLVLVEGVEKAQDIAPSNEMHPAFQIATPPTPNWNEQLGRALAEQLVLAGGSRDDGSCPNTWEGQGTYKIQVTNKESLMKRCCPAIGDRVSSAEKASASKSVVTLRALRRLESLLSGGIHYWCGNHLLGVVYISGIKAIADAEGTSSAAYKESVDALSQTVKLLKMVAEKGEQRSAVVLFPPVTGNTKRSTDPYGDYWSPALAAKIRRQEAEKPLESPSSSSSSSATSTTSASTTDSKSSPPTSTPSSNSTLPKGIIATCHSSKDACISATNNCSGHGECYHKYGSFGGAAKECFACKCQPTIWHDSDTGIHTVHWGGTACQKKDISIPFFLLAGISILLVGAMTWGIGLLFSVGEEALPSVIGAGVSAPRPK